MKNLSTISVVVYLILINLVGFFMMFLDKKRAERKEWRIRERTLFLLAVFGGSIGSWLGMQCFHHKTRHLKFVIGIPVILLLQIIGIIFLYYYSAS
jgi:Predicted membrane protein